MATISTYMYSKTFHNLFEEGAKGSSERKKDNLPLPLLSKEGIFYSPLYKGRYRGVLINLLSVPLTSFSKKAAKHGVNLAA